MEKRPYLFPMFILSLVIVLCIVFLGAIGWLGLFKNVVNWTVFSSSQALFSPFSHFSYDSSTINSLKKENTQLRLQLAQLQQLQQDNKALRDQFQAENSNPHSLLPATIVGRPNIIPNISFPEKYIINVGEKNGVTVGMAVIANNMIVGTISQTADYYSQVSLVSSNVSSFAGKDSKSGAIGVVKGQGNGTILFENVLLSQDLHVGDMVLTSGDESTTGIGYPPDIIVGKITGVEKSPSALYQSARVSTLLPLDTISTVFVMTK